MPLGPWRYALLASFVLAALVMILYWPAVDFRFLSFDDYYYTQNDLVAGGLDRSNILRIFTELSGEDLYTPMTQLSYMADAELFGMSPRGFHLTNILLFATGMALLPLVLWRMTGNLRQSAFAAALVAFHPLRVESVAWITERKDVLSVVFLLLSIACYLRYARTGRRRWFGILFIVYALGLLAKPMLVTLPALLLLLDYWPLGRFRHEGMEGSSHSSLRRVLLLLLEKVPLAALSLLVSLATVHLQRKLALHPGVSLGSRLEHSFSAAFVYLYQTLWPADLAFRYFDTPWMRFSGTLLPVTVGLALVTAMVAWSSGRRPYLAFGWAWYLIALFPVSGIVPTGIQWISDRFTFVPHMGFFIAFAWLSGDLLARRPRWVFPVLAFLLLLPLTIVSRHQLSFWKDGASLFGRGLSANGRDPRYINQYAEELVTVGDYARAREQLESLRHVVLDPFYGPPIQMTHLLLLEKMGDRRGAIEQALVFLRADPRFFRTRLRLAHELLEESRLAESAAEYRQVLQVPALDPRDRRYAREGLGYALFRMGRDDEALACYLDALRENPLASSLQYKFGLLLARRGEPGNALAHFSRSLEIDPRGLLPRLGIAELLLARGDINGAVRYFDDVARTAPGKAESRYAKGRVLEAVGMMEQATAIYESALAMSAVHPETVDAVQERLAKMSQGRDNEARGVPEK
jgi:tetratricopeptide (TPR) repeat protein